MITAWTFFRVYFPLKLHFTTNFDALKYNFKLPALEDKNKDKFLNRVDYSIFQSYVNLVKSAKHAGDICVANFRDDPNWIYNISREEAYKNYLHMVKVRDSLSRTYKQNLSLLSDEPNADEILKLFQYNKIEPETLIILNDFLKAKTFDILDTKCNNDPYIKRKLDQVNKYRSFFKYDKDKMFNLTQEKFSSG